LRLEDVDLAAWLNLQVVLYFLFYDRIRKSYWKIDNCQDKSHCEIFIGQIDVTNDAKGGVAGLTY
jgi:hypothetical protein